MQNKNLTFHSGLIVLIIILSGCGGIDFPDDKMEYIGYWKNDNMFIHIHESGMVNYERQKGLTHTEINMPIKEFEGDDFIVGALFIKTKFVVNKPPYNDNGIWKMTIDSTEVIRVEATSPSLTQ